MFAAENGLKGDPRLQAISEAIRVVPHFPKPGIMFQDITTLLLDHKAFKHTVDIFVDRYRDMDISVVAGRGFELGCILGSTPALANLAKPISAVLSIFSHTVKEGFDEIQFFFLGTSFNNKLFAFSPALLQFWSLGTLFLIFEDFFAI
ncbi:adenine phosphoribosyltransferase 5-like [Prunus avium]|uniref:adenine phosphoribosyltransferase n=1 Tax=Prunus avium TaxID=42229 RepID=A0A6P5RM58_PRUAV|nr:adenine phosphoribosyltransferase 5-like [Prunus avium]